MVDADILRQSEVSTEIWLPTYFSSSILVLNLESCESVHNIHQHISSGVSYALACDVG